MTDNTFDPQPDTLYAKCVTCDLDLPTEYDARAHRTATMANSPDKRSHTTRTRNPSREQRIRTAVDTIVSDAIEEAMSNVDDLIARGRITEDEATAAMRHQDSEWSDAWTEWMEDGA